MEIPGKSGRWREGADRRAAQCVGPKAYRKAVALLAESGSSTFFGVENSLTPAMDLFTASSATWD